MAKGVNTIIDTSKTIKGNPAYKTFKYGSKGYKADQKGHITGKEGQVTNAISQNVVNPVVNQVNQAGPTKLFRNMYDQMKNPTPANNQINQLYQPNKKGTNDKA